MFVKALLNTIILVFLLLIGCDTDIPMRIGFLGGLSDVNSDVGISGQKGVILAVDK